MIFVDYLLNVDSPKISFKQPVGQTKLDVHYLNRRGYMSESEPLKKKGEVIIFISFWNLA